MDNTSIYNSIIDKLEQQKKDVKITTKLYRFTGLIQAIEYFSQRLAKDQIIDAAFDFINELLTIEKSAAFILQDGNCIMLKQKGYASNLKIEADITNLQNLARMHGTVLYDRNSLEKYFDAGMLDNYKVTALLPLIISGSLHAFILMSRKTAGDMDQDDVIISEALMRLINNALDNHKSYEDLQKSNKELDEKIFNLFAINQSSKVLLSELDLDVLYKLSVDVFSELTQSSVTGFVLFDEDRNNYSIRAYRDVFTNKSKSVTVILTRNDAFKVDGNKIIIDTSNNADMEYFNGIFNNGSEALKPLNTVFIVMLVKNERVLGFVTLGNTITGSLHKSSEFELIESLASATYIAISNAMYFKKVNEQKMQIQDRLKNLLSLNTLVKKINSALKTETLIELTMNTLQEAFDVKQGFVALYDAENNEFKLPRPVKDVTGISAIATNKNWHKLFKGNVILSTSWQDARKYFSKDFYESLAIGDGALLVPIYVERIGLEVLGAIMIFKYGSAMLDNEENILTVETIANHIAPAMGNLITMEEHKRFSLPNYIELFKRDLKREINKAIEFGQKLQVIRIDINREFTFKSDSLHDKLKSNFEMVYSITHNNIFIIHGEDDRRGDSNLHRLIGKEQVNITFYNLGTEFTNFQDFFSLF